MGFWYFSDSVISVRLNTCYESDIQFIVDFKVRSFIGVSVRFVYNVCLEP